jgi:hypothetical protein
MSRTDCEFDGLAWQFTDSVYAEDAYADWPLDRRLEGFLRHRGLAGIAGAVRLGSTRRFAELTNDLRRGDFGPFRYRRPIGAMESERNALRDTRRQP